MLEAHPEVKTVLLPRTHKQEEELRSAKPGLFSSGRMIVPKHAVDGLDLIWYSDLVISGGGTMNREAAALGIPVYSLFRGRMGAVDKHLAESGRLVLLQSVEDVRTKLNLARRNRTAEADGKQFATLQSVVDQVCEITGRAKA
jgi:predicted glycosyltransferase